MRVTELIKIADAAYPGGLVKEGTTTPSAGDSLRTFVVREIKSCYDPNAGSFEQAVESMRAVHAAINDLAAVAIAFRNEALDCVRRGADQISVKASPAVQTLGVAVNALCAEVRLPGGISGRVLYREELAALGKLGDKVGGLTV